MKQLLLIVTTITLIGSAQARTDNRAHQIGSIKTIELAPLPVKKDSYLSEKTPDSGSGGETTGDTGGGGTTGDSTSGGSYGDGNDPIDRGGRIISVAKDVVALGEAVYELMNKNRPKITTEYAPISVLPKDPTTKEAIDLFDMEGFSMPVEKRFQTKITDKIGKPAVIFDYKLMYSYGGSYNGTGKYLTGITIIPGNIQAKRGWIIDSSMKLGGIMNHGTKANPIVGAIITIKYQISSMGKASERNDTIHITGDGKVRTFMK